MRGRVDGGMTVGAEYTVTPALLRSTGTRIHSFESRGGNPPIGELIHTSQTSGHELPFEQEGGVPQTGALCGGVMLIQQPDTD